MGRMEALLAAISEMVRIISGSQMAGDPHFHDSRVTWALLVTRIDASTSTTEIPDPDNKYACQALLQNTVLSDF